MKFPFRLIALFSYAAAAGALQAQTAVAGPDTAKRSRPDAEVAADVARLTESLKLRSDLAASVAGGKVKPGPALAQLRKAASPAGLKLDDEAEFALAATDIGRRLVATGHYAEADAFFQEAEKSLDKLVKKTPDTDAPQKSQYLRKLAGLRVDYLDKAEQANADFDAAIKLQPGDKELRRTRDHLGSQKGKTFGTKGRAKLDDAKPGDPTPDGQTPTTKG